jgi:hypothetical protein
VEGEVEAWGGRGDSHGRERAEWCTRQAAGSSSTG